MPRYKFTIGKETGEEKEIEIEAPNQIRAMDAIMLTEGETVEFIDFEEVNEDDK
jgi:hypothetical protein